MYWEVSAFLDMLRQYIGDFEIGLWNGYAVCTEVDCSLCAEFSTVEVRAQDFEDTWESTAPDVEAALRKIVGQIDANLFCLPEEKTVKVFNNLMQEMANIAAAMNMLGAEAVVGRDKGPSFSVGFTFLGEKPKANLFFGKLSERYRGPDGDSSVFFESEGKTMLEAIEKVVARARNYLKSKRPVPEASVSS